MHALMEHDVGKPRRVVHHVGADHDVAVSIETVFTHVRAERCTLAAVQIPSVEGSHVRGGHDVHFDVLNQLGQAALDERGDTLCNAREFVSIERPQNLASVRAIDRRGVVTGGDFQREHERVRVLEEHALFSFGLGGVAALHCLEGSDSSFFLFFGQLNFSDWAGCLGALDLDGTSALGLDLGLFSLGFESTNGVSRCATLGQRFNVTLIYAASCFTLAATSRQRLVSLTTTHSLFALDKTRYSLFEFLTAAGLSSALQISRVTQQLHARGVRRLITTLTHANTRGDLNAFVLGGGHHTNRTLINRPPRVRA